jgi:hypothetical protein
MARTCSHGSDHKRELVFMVRRYSNPSTLLEAEKKHIKAAVDEFKGKNKDIHKLASEVYEGLQDKYLRPQVKAIFQKFQKYKGGAKGCEKSEESKLLGEKSGDAVQAGYGGSAKDKIAQCKADAHIESMARGWRLSGQWNPSDPYKDKQLKEALAHCTAIFKVRAGWCDTCCCKKGLVDWSIHSEVIAHDDSHGHHAWKFTHYCHADRKDTRGNFKGDTRWAKKPVNLSRDFTVFQNYRQTWGGCGAWFNIVDMLVRAVSASVRTTIYNIRYANGASGLRCVDPKCLECTQ